MKRQWGVGEGQASIYWPLGASRGRRGKVAVVDGFEITKSHCATMRPGGLTRPSSRARSYLSLRPILAKIEQGKRRNGRGASGRRADVDVPNGGSHSSNSKYKFCYIRLT